MPLLENLEEFKNVSPALQWAIFIIAVLIALVAFFSTCVSIWLAIKYIRFNRRKNSIGKTGKEVARNLLDKNGLGHIKVSVWGSMLFGNSYSHYFKKVRLRRLTQNKKSITSLAMASQKSALAIMDKNGDVDMKSRIRLTPFIYFGPFAFIPLILIGVAIDYLLFNLSGAATVICASTGLLLYVISFILSIKVLKTEVKAQKLAINILKKENMATSEEIDMMQELYKLYNIQYVNDIIIAFLQMIYRVLMLIAKIQQNSSNNK